MLWGNIVETVAREGSRLVRITEWEVGGIPYCAMEEAKGQWIVFTRAARADGLVEPIGVLIATVASKAAALNVIEQLATATERLRAS